MSLLYSNKIFYKLNGPREITLLYFSVLEDKPHHKRRDCSKSAPSHDIRDRVHPEGNAAPGHQERHQDEGDALPPDEERKGSHHREACG